MSHLYFQDTESYANKEFVIGDGKEYGGYKNYALCAKECYTVHLLLILDNATENSNEKKDVDLRENILQVVKTNAICMGEFPKNYAMLTTTLIYIFLISVLLILLVYRKKYDVFLNYYFSTMIITLNQGFQITY